MHCTDTVLLNLQDAGCDDRLIADYRAITEQPLPEASISGRQAQLLRGYRRELLDRLHEDQRKLDCLDHLLYQLRDEAAGKRG